MMFFYCKYKDHYHAVVEEVNEKRATENEFEMFMKTHHGVSLARDEARDKYKYGDAQMYWECWNAAQQSVQADASNGWQKFIRWLCGLFTPRR